MLTVEQADQITQEWVEANVDLERARECYRGYPCRRENQKLNRLDYAPEYEWMIDRLGDVSVLVEIGVDEVVPSEGDWKVALQYETTRQYIEWFRQGPNPPLSSDDLKPLLQAIVPAPLAHQRLLAVTVPTRGTHQDRAHSDRLGQTVLPDALGQFLQGDLVKLLAVVVPWNDVCYCYLPNFCHCLYLPIVPRLKYSPVSFSNTGRSISQ